jgi:hypothetical protein
MNQVDRSPYLDIFRNHNIVSNLEELNALPEDEFGGTLYALEESEPIIQHDNDDSQIFKDSDPLPELSIEQRIAALTGSEGQLTILDQLELGKSNAKQFLKRYNGKPKQRIRDSPLAFLQ